MKIVKLGCEGLGESGQKLYHVVKFDNLPVFEYGSANGPYPSRDSGIPILNWDSPHKVYRAVEGLQVLWNHKYQKKKEGDSNHSNL